MNSRRRQYPCARIARLRLGYLCASGGYNVHTPRIGLALSCQCTSNDNRWVKKNSPNVILIETSVFSTIFWNSSKLILPS